MKDLLKKVLGLFACGIILAGFSGCGAKDDAGDALTVCSFNNLLQPEFIDALHEVYPEVELEVISYAGTNGSGYAQYSLENGDIPDIYITSQDFSSESQERYLLDLSNYDFVNNYSGVLLDSLDVNGRIYLLPSGYTLTGIYYNKTILKENGWDVPQSFDELVRLSEKIEAAGYRTMGCGMSLDGYPFNYFFNIGNTVYFGTPEGTSWKEDFPQGLARAEGNSGLKRAAEYFNKWVEHGFITPEHTSSSKFFGGECVFFLCLGINNYKYTTEDGKTYEFGTIPWLSEDGSNNMLTRNVSGYMGINKSLAEKGKEKKLENALKVLRYISTAEGQQAFLNGSSQYMSSLNGGTLPEDSPYQEIAGLVSEGRTVPLLYVGWEHLVVPIAQDIKELLSGETDVEGLLEAFDKTNDAFRNQSSDDVYAKCTGRLTMEQTAQLVATAQGEAAEADCAMISLNEYHDGLSNIQGLGWYFYEGNIDAGIVNMVRPRAAVISVLELSGAEIKAMQQDGFDLDANGNPYPYLLFTRDGITLEDDVTYKLAISAGELAGGMAERAVQTEISTFQAIVDYIRKLGTISADHLGWEYDK